MLTVYVQPFSVSSSPSPPEEIDLSAVPSEYHDLKQVFSKDKALSLPLRDLMIVPLTYSLVLLFRSKNLYNLS